MKKKFLASILARPILAMMLIILAIFFLFATVSNMSTIFSWIASLLNWATTHEPCLLLITIALVYISSALKTFGMEDKHSHFIKGTLWYRLTLPISKLTLDIAHKNSHLWSGVIKNRLNRIGNFILWTSVILLFLNLFPIFNSWGLLKEFNIFLGAIFGIAIGLLLIANLPNHIDNRLFIGILFLEILFLAYYLDCFIFAWNKPWISCVVIILGIGALIFIFIKNLRQELAKKRAIKNQEKLERRKIEAREKTIQEIAKLGMYKILLKYLELKKYKSDHDTASLYLEAYSEAKKEFKSMSAGETKLILQKISFLNYTVDAEFFYFLLAELGEDDYQTILLTTTCLGMAEEELPILFRYCDNKKAVLKIISKLDTDVLYNDVKREFRLKEFIGLINAITYSYTKEWDDRLWLKTTVASLEMFISFAVDCVEQVWSIEEAVKITAALAKIEENYLRKGIQIKFPEKLQIIKEKFLAKK